MRILSLLPAATDMLTSMGLADLLVGCTHECDARNANDAIPRVTQSRIASGMSSVEIDRLVRESSVNKEPLTRIDCDLVRSLRPDVVISQGLCEVCAITPNQLQKLAKQLGRDRTQSTAIRWVEIVPKTLEQVFQSMRDLGEAIGRTEESNALVLRLQERMAKLEERHRGTPAIATVALEWLNPFFNVGHWTPELLQKINLMDKLGNPGGHSHPCSWEDIIALKPEVLLFACCGRTRDETASEIEQLSNTIPWSHLPAMAKGQYLVLDGNTSFSRPGPQLVDTMEEISSWLASKFA